jgi:hypothetical protein
MRRAAPVVLAAVLLCAGGALLHCSSSAQSAPCTPGDQDGVSGGVATLDLAVDDTSFTPILLKAQNEATVTLTLANHGTRPHDFVVACLATPNDLGCPATSCFPDAAAIGPVAPDASVTASFVTPNPEGIYVFHSDLPGDTQSGQFIVQ